ncbi:MAG: hypothetical protein LLF95_09220 [Bacteroidales bacterium]|nr:hypothetical protein [Bacteroidales bacterium]
MKKKFLFIGFFVVSLGAPAQKTADYSAVDNKISQIPDSSMQSTQSIARFINSNFSNQNDKVRAVYCWVAKNIQYDVKNMFAVNFYENEQEIIDKTLKTRKGVCMGYAVLFSDIANKTGIKSYVVDGYTKQNGKVDYVPHAWVVAKVDSDWHLFDPTWGAGYVLNSKFTKQLNNIYFKIKPEEMIKSHMPFDPIWQLLNYTVSNEEFNQDKTTENTKKLFFNFNDSIASYENQSKTEQLTAATRRLEKNGVSNTILFDRYQYNKREIEYLINKQYSEIFNKAVSDYNESIRTLNEFTDYRNKQFTPAKPDPLIKLMLENAESSLERSKSAIAGINTADPSIKMSVNQLKLSIDDAYKQLNEQKVFLAKYLSTGKLFRKSLFYKYTWMGIPLN